MTWQSTSGDLDPKLVVAGELLHVAAETIRRASEQISESSLSAQEIHEVGQLMDPARIDVAAGELIARGYGRAE